MTILLITLLILCLGFALISFICFKMAFFVIRQKETRKEEFDIPKGKIYKPFREQMENWMREVRQMPHQKFSITSFDGLKLCAKYYEFEPGAPIELMFHGYRGTAERDLCGGVQRCFSLGRSAFIVDQRCSGESQGNVITFGVKEHRDCLAWIDFMVKHFGKDVKIILTGISMGASTVLMAAGKPLPKNVTGVLADCGFSSAESIIKTVIRKMKLPVRPAYFFVKLGALLYGRFNLEEAPPVEAIKNCTVPVIFFHGEADDFVPCKMSKENFDACPTRKRLVTIPGAGHGLGYLIAPNEYLKAAKEFFD